MAEGPVSDQTVLRPRSYVDYGSHLHVGARTFADVGLVALDVATMTIGDDSVVGGGSVVTKDVPANVVAAARPRASSAPLMSTALPQPAGRCLDH